MSSQFKWSNDQIEQVGQLRMSGLPLFKIAEIMTERMGRKITYDGVDGILKRSGLRFTPVEMNPEVKVYKEMTIPMDDYIVSCDHHAPYHSELWCNRLLAVAERFKIRKHIIAGDLYDFNFASKFPAEERKDIDKEGEDSKSILNIVAYFDKNYFIQGNHERRAGIFTEGMIRARHIFTLYGQDVYAKKIVYSLYDRIWIEDKYLIMHPKSYSQISTAVGKRMAEKFHAHILNAHGHFVGLTYDRSGKYMCVDLGGLFDPAKIEYCSLRTSTHPVWNPGFAMIKGGKFFLFHQESDWKFWLGGK
ncbi:MAG: hypothetical protein WC455_22895 [Dehalococcoidia bacterium]|jgi:hypothetical protein